MSNKWGVKPDQAEVLMELEELIRRSIILVDEIELYNPHDILGVKTKEDDIIGLGLQHCELEFLPESLTNLQSLQVLDISRNKLTSLPESIRNLKALQILVVTLNDLTLIPESIGNLQSLQALAINQNLLISLPESIGNLKSLKTLLLDENKLKSLPESIGNLQFLKSLNLYKNQLASLPESIGNLQSLQVLRLSENHLTALPESIGNIKTLKNLGLYGNYLTTLPESIGNLRLLQKLYLNKNYHLNTLPESIGNLHSLQILDLTSNELTSLPKSLWQLNNLETIKLENNKWEGEWKELSKRDGKTLITILRQRVSINIFISHTVNEFDLYKIKQLAEYLENQSEINQVYFCEEDLKGNIDKWMEETVPKSHLLLFIGTQQSLLSKDCWNELYLARKHNIEVTPIKGVDASWEDLSKVGLSRNLGFEFNANKFDKLCEGLYKYICEFKHERDLLRKDDTT